MGSGCHGIEDWRLVLSAVIDRYMNNIELPEENICPSIHFIVGAPGVWGSGENDYLFSGSWGALAIIFRYLGSKSIVLGI